MDKRYLGLTLLLLAVEVAIALFVNDTIIRPFVGDVLVVVLVFCFLAIFFTPNTRLIVFVFLFAAAVEISQYFDLVAILGQENNRLVSTVLGRTFSWLDFLAYFTGALLCLPLRFSSGVSE